MNSFTIPCTIYDEILVGTHSIPFPENVFFTKFNSILFSLLAL